MLRLAVPGPRCELGVLVGPRHVRRGFGCANSAAAGGVPRRAGRAALRCARPGAGAAETQGRTARGSSPALIQAGARAVPGLARTRTCARRDALRARTRTRGSELVACISRISPLIHGSCGLLHRHTKARLLEEKHKRLEKKMQKKHAASDTSHSGPLLDLGGSANSLRASHTRVFPAGHAWPAGLALRATHPRRVASGQSVLRSHGVFGVSFWGFDVLLGAGRQSEAVSVLGVSALRAPVQP